MPSSTLLFDLEPGVKVELEEAHSLLLEGPHLLQIKREGGGDVLRKKGGGK